MEAQRQIAKRKPSLPVHLHVVVELLLSEREIEIGDGRCKYDVASHLVMSRIILYCTFEAVNGRERVKSWAGIL